jgi:hypothetical protein
MEKWKNECPITGCNISRILISSHIVPWSECNDEERLDVDNGILLSPNVDSLFDKHLISFKDTGEMIISSKLSIKDLERLGVSIESNIPISEGMKKYLEKHRTKLYKND